MNLFDSSAIINLCGEKRIDKLFEGWTLNLAFYELGNAVWKQTYIHRTVTPEEAGKLLDALTEVFINMKKPEKENGLGTLKIAVREGLTYYDAAYIQAAVENKLTLVTDDEKLYRVAKKFVKTMKSNELDL